MPRRVLRRLRDWRGALSADRLAVRLALILTVALLPVGVIAVLQTASLMRDSAAAEHAALVRATSDALSGQRAVVESLFVSARTLGPIAAGRRGEPGECTRIVTDFARASPLVLFAGVLGPDGRAGCMSAGAGEAFAAEAAAAPPVWIAPVPMVGRHARGAWAETPALIAALPFWDEAGFAGHMLVAVLESNLGLIRQDRDAPLPLAAVLLNAAGQVVHVWPENTGGEVWQPEDETLLHRAPGRTDRAVVTRNRAGQRVALVTTPLIPEQLFAVGVWPEGMAGGAGRPGRIAASLAFPVLMWLISLAVAYGAVFRLVVRHIRQINGAMRRFALGRHEAPDLDPASAPAELRELMSTLGRMMRVIEQDKAELTASVQEKTVLLKEVHHRVKNNFQLISSIINLQLRKLRAAQADPSAPPADAAAVLRSVQDRVLGLAAIHRAYYEAGNVAEVRADRLLGSILDQIVTAAGEGGGAGPEGGGVRVVRRLDPVPLAPDQIVPLSLILTECLTEALRSGAAGVFELVLRAGPGGIVQMVLTRPVPADGPAGAPGGGAAQDDTGLRQQLLETLTLQLEGRLVQEVVGREGGAVQRFVLTFHAAAPPAAAGQD